ncbi:MAG TPA: U32 family peptidase [Tepidisphaeraceae bacterium]|jgi:putative protease|nr:U32 family peptidase [Tepidisphaeraceae bacterium]
MRTDRPIRPELLAPAGDFDAMRAAVANGADAVYFGLPNFNARHRATNFTLEQLPEVMAYLHGHNVRGYVTFNTLIFSDELPEAVEFIKSIAAAGVDAVIVQDLGLANLIHQLAPTLHVHGSTQMTLTEPRGVEFVRQLGVSRVILARELSATDIQAITSATDLPVEIFIHGALCISYSGQCLTSEALGGRSANRGQCAQACRLPYDLLVDGQLKDLGDKAYLVSPQDLAAHDLIGDLVHLGVCSFKIEGRLKSAHYVAATTQTYRSALDAAIASRPFLIAPQQKLDLAQSFSRGFSHGFLSGVNHQTLVPARFPKSRGIRAGTVSSISDHSVTVQLENHPASFLKPGDGIVFDEGHPDQDEQGGRIFHSRIANNPKLIELTFGHGALNFAALSPGAIVWKTDDPAVRKRLEQSFSRDTVTRREPLTAHLTARVGQHLSITFTDAANRSATATWDRPLELAQNRPITSEVAKEQLSRLGDTPYELADVTLDVDPVMIPKSVLNDLRRQAIDQLLKECQRSHAIADPDTLSRQRSEIKSQSSSPSRDFFASSLRGLRDLSSSTVPTQPATPSLYILTRTLDQLQAVLNWTPAVGDRPSMVYCDFEDVRRYKDAVPLARAAGIPIALATMRIVKPHEDGFLQILADCNPDAILVRNLAAIAFFSELRPDLPLIGDYALNVANELTADLFHRANVRRMVPSYDLNWQQLAAMLSHTDPGLFETVIHQHIPMFHMEHCVFAATLSTGKDFRDCGRPCEKHSVDLKDREGQPHPLIPDAGCRNTLFNAAAQSAAEYVPRMKQLGLRHFRIELLRETPDEAIALLNKYASVLAGLDDGHNTWRQLRVLNQLGVTRGTLENE